MVIANRCFCTGCENVGISVLPPGFKRCLLDWKGLLPVYQPAEFVVHTPAGFLHEGEGRTMMGCQAKEHIFF